MEITNYAELQKLYAELPEGTTADYNAVDLATGNIDNPSFELPSGEIINVKYTGEVVE